MNLYIADLFEQTRNNIYLVPGILFRIREACVTHRGTDNRWFANNMRRVKGAPPPALPAAAAAVAAAAAAAAAAYILLRRLRPTAAAAPIINERLLLTDLRNEWSREICSSCTSM